MKIIRRLWILKDSPGGKNSLGLLLTGIATLVAVSPNTAVVPYVILAILIVAVGLFVSAENYERFEAFAGGMVDEIVAGSLYGQINDGHNFNLFICTAFSENAYQDVIEIGKRFDGVIIYHDVNGPIPDARPEVSRMPLLEAGGGLTKLVWEENSSHRTALYSEETDHWIVLPNKPSLSAIGKYVARIGELNYPFESVNDYRWVCEILRREVAGVKPLQNLARYGQVDVRGHEDIRRTQYDLTLATTDVRAIDDTPPLTWIHELEDLMVANAAVTSKDEGRVRRLFVIDELDKLSKLHQLELAVIVRVQINLGVEVGFIKSTDLDRRPVSDMVIYHDSILFEQDPTDASKGTFFAAKSPAGAVRTAIDLFDEIWMDRRTAAASKAGSWLEMWEKGAHKQEDPNGYWRQVNDLERSIAAQLAVEQASSS